MSLTPDRFAEFYTAVYSKPDEPREAFPWQVRLTERLCNEKLDPKKRWPRAVALPTAAGKTTCIDIALFALACGATGAARRIVFVVDRRVVVDQAFDHARKLAKKLDRADAGPMLAVADRLRDIADPGWLALPEAERGRVLAKRHKYLDSKKSGERESILERLDAVERRWFFTRPLDVYALRGGLYRETAWARSPLQPTVLASTVDQIGSRLLFRGYGVSPGMRPIHAGLVGNDALILLDEAHCARPFGETMRRIEDYRGRFRTDGDVTPFAFAELTATPSGDVAPEELFKLDETPGGLDLDPDAADGSPKKLLYRRMSAAKPARLVVSGTVADKPATGAKDREQRKQLVATLAEQARGLLAGHRAVGVIVNRVATARELAAELKTAEKGVEPPDVILLTGRMRPVDRDAIMKRIEPLMSGNTTPLEKPTIVVATQCLEVGADLDFHALVTECASLDALRQRFGRLNRVAARATAAAAVVIRGDQTTDTETDPVYGASLALTWQWLNANPGGEFDFGVLAVNKLVAALPVAELRTLCAPTDDAAVLLPAHLDGWVQTSPPPTPDRDIAPYLHGPKRGVPDVSVVFRNDLGDDAEQWTKVVELCPPSSAEALPVKITVFKAWLAGTLVADDTSDADEAAPEEPKRGDDPDPTGRVALRWRGPDDSGLVRDGKELRPGDTLVLRCTDADVNLLGDFPTLPPADCGDAAFLVARDKAVLRLPGFPGDPDDDDFNDRLADAVAEKLPTDLPPDVRAKVVKHLTHNTLRLIQPYPEPLAGRVITGRRRLGRYDPEFLDDTASSASPTLRPITLEAHSAGVAGRARRFADGCGLAGELYHQAGLFHDVGKLDPRFQGWLLGGRRRPLGDPLAKSGAAGGTKADRDAARQRSGYPTGGRHEALSVALLAPKTNDDLLLHLVATHHGAARPFISPPAEVVGEVPLTAKLFGVSFATDDCRQRPADWNPAFAERFWRVVRQYGWWGSAYRETVFRLADQAQSAAEQEEDHTAPATRPTAADFPPPAPSPELVPLPLPGLDGANPLAFLAALGALRLADKAFDGRAKLSWHRAGRWTPTLHVPPGVTTESLAATLLEVAHAGREVFGLPDNLSFTPDVFRAFQVVAAGLGDREFGDFLTVLGDERAVNDTGDVRRMQFYMMSATQQFIKNAKNLVARTGPDHVVKCLTRRWEYDDPSEKLSLRIDPTDDVRHALRFREPTGDPTRGERGSMMGANRLAFEGLAVYFSAASGKSLRTAGFETEAGSTYFAWPAWTGPQSLDATRSLVSLGGPPGTPVRETGGSGYGVTEVLRVERIKTGKFSNFAPATTG